MPCVAASSNGWEVGGPLAIVKVMTRPSAQRVHPGFRDERGLGVRGMGILSDCTFCLVLKLHL